MQKVKLDRIDRRLLHDLQAEGRITNVELSKRAGISAPPCLRRVRALEDAGFIRSYHACLDPKALGFHVTVFAQVGLSSQAEADLAGKGRLLIRKSGTEPLVRVMAEHEDAVLMSRAVGSVVEAVTAAVRV
mgnify:CR=1 FL=1